MLENLCTILFPFASLCLALGIGGWFVDRSVDKKTERKKRRHN